jgi:hypothetical protein
METSSSNEIKAHVLACLLTSKLVRESESGGVVTENKHLGKEFVVSKSVTENNLELLNKINNDTKRQAN